jgi:Uma2 family endonuclease
MVAIIEKPKILTLEDFLKLPDTKPASEFIKGEITQKPMPQGKHSTLQIELASAINQQTKSQKLAYALPELRCTFSDRSIVPDIAVIRWQNLPKDQDGKIADQFNRYPDWSIEILSPEQNYSKVLEKLLHCSREGTELGWLINPSDETILSIFPEQKIELYQGNIILPILTGINLELTPDIIFNWLNL